MTRDILQELVRPIWAEQLRRRREKHLFKMRSINAESAAKGILHSGAHTWTAFEASVIECRLRALRARKILHLAVRQTESALTAEDLRSLYLDLTAGSDYTGMNRDIDRLMGEVLDLVPSTPKQRGDQMLALAKEQVAAIDSEIAELALFAAKPKAMSQPGPGGIVVHGPVYGAVQSGSQSNANVTVVFDHAGAAVLRDAVQLLRASLKSVPPPDLPEYADAILASLESESASPDPRPERLRGLLTASAAIIGTLANVPGAWEAVKHAASALSIQWP